MPRLTWSAAALLDVQRLYRFLSETDVGAAGRAALQIDRAAINGSVRQQAPAAAVRRNGMRQIDQQRHQHMPLVQGFGEFSSVTHVLVHHSVAQLS